MLAPLVLLLWISPPLAGQDARVADAPRSVRQGIYTAAQADRGQRLFREVCSDCHLPGQFTGPAFLLAWKGQPVDALFDLIRTTMPEDSPGSLRAREYAAILSYLFRLNGLPPGEEAMPDDPEALARIRIEAPPPDTAGHER